MNAAVPEPGLSPDLVESILSKFGLSGRPTLDPVGLNALYAAWCGNVPFDNVHKRIWFAGDHAKPLTGGDPAEFFTNWLIYGTGGTCWPTSGAMYALVVALGFCARRIAGPMISPGGEDSGAGHGSVLVTIDGADYLVDASILAFEALPLVTGVPASAGEGIHAINAVPIGERFDVAWHPGHMRETLVHFRPNPEYDPVDHAFFLDGYERSKVICPDNPFNDALHICRRRPDSIVTIRRKHQTSVAADGSVRELDVTETERSRILVDELGLSEEIVAALPPDEPQEDSSA